MNPLLNTTLQQRAAIEMDRLLQRRCVSPSESSIKLQDIHLRFRQIQLKGLFCRRTETHRLGSEGLAQVIESIPQENAASGTVGPEGIGQPVSLHNASVS